jgi:hypothetical protein
MTYSCKPREDGECVRGEMLRYQSRAALCLLFAFSSIAVVVAHLGAQTEEDQHRLACTDASCHKIRTFLKHYCGESPFGNGPEESCDVRNRHKRSPDVKVIADYNCEWNASKNAAECKQQGQITPELRGILASQLRQLGVPDKPPGETYFTVWQSNRVDWFLTQAYYSHRIGDDMEVCEVIAIVSANAM